MLYPGHNYLGPGNPLENGEPVDDADVIAREHDFAYANAKQEKDIYASDLLAIKKFGKHFLTHGDLPSLVGASGLGVKTSYERLIGHTVYGMPKDNDHRVPWGYNKQGQPYYNYGQRLYADRASGKKRKAKDDEGNSSRKVFALDTISENNEDMDPVDETDQGAEAADEQMQGDAPAAAQKKTSKAAQGGGGDGSGSEGSIIVRNVFGPSGVLKFKRSRIMVSWANQLYVAPGDNASKDHHFVTTPLSWLPVQYLMFYMSPAEYDCLPIGSRVQNVKCNVIPLGCKVSFNTGTTNTAWTNSTQTVFGMSAVGLNRTGWVKAHQIKSRDASMPMKITGTEEVNLDRLKERLWGKAQSTTSQQDALKELPSTLCVFRSLPYYTSVACPAGGRPFPDTWPDISKHVEQWEFSGMINKSVLDYSYSPNNGIIKSYPFARIYGGDDYDSVKYYAGNSVLSSIETDVVNDTTANNLGMKLSVKTREVVHNEKFDYEQHIEKYGSFNPGSNQSYLIQPSAHVGINGVQANAPDEGLNVVPEFINAAAYWCINTEMIVSFDVEKPFNYTQNCRNMQLDFMPKGINTDPWSLHNYHELGYYTNAAKK